MLVVFFLTLLYTNLNKVSLSCMNNYKIDTINNYINKGGNMFNRDTYIERRKKLKERVGEGIILICGNDESPMNYADNCFQFTQDSTFLYFYGIDRAGLFGLIDLDNDREYIFGTDFTIDDTVWMGPLSFLNEEALKCGIENTGEIPDLTSILAEAKTKGRKVHYTHQYRHLNIINHETHVTLDSGHIRNTQINGSFHLFELR